MIKINDPEVLRVPVKVNGEVLVEILNLPRVYLPSGIKTNIGITDSKNMLVRESVREMLKNALNELPKGHGFVFIEGYRSYYMQKGLFEKECARQSQLNPNMSTEEISRCATQYVSNPDVYSPHITGSAIDLAIVDERKEMLDMGNMFVYNDSANSDYQGLTKEQVVNRELLKTVMGGVGFVNYPYEWWHWSYGDKYWGFITNNSAFYDGVKLN